MVIELDWVQKSTQQSQHARRKSFQYGKDEYNTPGNGLQMCKKAWEKSVISFCLGKQTKIKKKLGDEENARGPSQWSE